MCWEMCWSAHKNSKRQSFWKTNKIREEEDILKNNYVPLTTDMYIA